MENVATIAKIDQDRRRVFGWANVAVAKDGSTVIDSHDHCIDPEDLEEACYQFALEFRDAGLKHKGASTGRMIECFMSTPEKLVAMGLASDSLPIGMWVGFQIDDPATWDQVKKGNVSMFSIQGRAVPVEVE